MKNPARVAELLAELRELADNDFERHRIDVLERDLTAPPTVEVIDAITQTFCGEHYRQTSSGHYAKYNGLHRVVWAYYNGEIPNGYEVHHRDDNPANNTIENLQCLTKAEHNRIHLARLHRVHQPTQSICRYCGKPYLKNNVGISKYCSDECFHHAQRHNNIQEKICVVCGTAFTTSDSRIKCCSVNCGNKLGHTLRGTPKEKICPVCGKTFISKRSKQKCCSRSCGYKFRYNH